MTKISRITKPYYGLFYLPTGLLIITQPKSYLLLLLYKNSKNGYSIS